MRTFFLLSVSFLLSIGVLGQNVTVNFVINDNSETEKVIVSKGGKIKPPAEPAIEDFTFRGWYRDTGLSQEFDFNETINKNLTLYAKLLPNIFDYKVSYAGDKPRFITIHGLVTKDKSVINKLYIPSNIGGIPVKKIGEGAFKYNNSITEVYLEEGVSDLLNSCFEGCTNLTKVNLPKSIVYIGTYAFFRCASLSGTIKIPDNIKLWGASSFRECESIEKVYLSRKFNLVPANTFKDCRNLKEIYVDSFIVDPITSVKDPIKANIDILDGCHKELTIYVLPELVEKYKDAENWDNYARRITAISN